MRSRRMKGSILDIGFIIILIFFSATVVLLAQAILTNLTNNLGSSGVINVTYLSYGQTGLQVINTGYIIIFVGLVLASAIGAYYVYFHPVFLIVGISGLSIFIMMAAELSNVYVAIASDSNIIDAANQLNIITQMMQNLTYLTLFGGIIILMAVFMKVPGRGSTV